MLSVQQIERLKYCAQAFANQDLVMIEVIKVNPDFYLLPVMSIDPELIENSKDKMLKDAYNCALALFKMIADENARSSSSVNFRNVREKYLSQSLQARQQEYDTTGIRLIERLGEQEETIAKIKKKKNSGAFSFIKDAISKMRNNSDRKKAINLKDEEESLAPRKKTA